MPQRDVTITLRQMLDHAREAVGLASGLTRTSLESKRVLSLAIVRLLEILGEAANRVPAAERAHYPQIAWAQLIGLRNRLIHAYDAVDFDILWRILSQDLPVLVAELEKLVS